MCRREKTMSDIRELLTYINPAECSYQEWINVGMALKQEGLTAFDWDAWSKADHRYKPGECWKKWDSFQGSSTPVTGGTIYELARRGGYAPEGSGKGTALDWDSTIVKDDLKVVDPGWLEEREIEEPGPEWNPVQDLITYIQTLFQSTENVGYVTDVYENEDRLSPKKGNWDRTAGQLLEELRRCGGDIGSVVGDCNPKAGAWIRFNPLDGNGVKNENVTDFRYALVESDSLPLAKQNAIIRELELPVACLVYSGGKSIHAIVKVNAPDYSEYRRRVEYLYKVCDKNGLKVDTQNKNPSRLSRMPGVVRNGHKQFLIATNIGKGSWEEWQEWIDGVNDDLPDPVSLETEWENGIPPLADCLIENVLRKGHKMLLAGPSKAGKSFLLIELAIAISEGREWLGFQCAQGRVLYVNLELDRVSCLHRFQDVYKTLGIEKPCMSMIDVWNLRGKAVPMDKLAPKLIRRSEKKEYAAVIIDPLYKVITGNENSADEMAAFFNQFDKICTALKTAVVYCHHHSKGAQGGKKSMDRVSGSGVFARDPDALLDLSELELTKQMRDQLAEKLRLQAITRALDQLKPGWRGAAIQEDLDNAVALQNILDNFPMSDKQLAIRDALLSEAETRASRLTGWRIEGTLREFPSFDPLDLWFDYPIHYVDQSDMLKDVKVDDGQRKKWSEMQREKGRAATEALIQTIGELIESGPIPCKDLAAATGKSNDNMRMTLKRKKKDLEKAGYVFDDGVVRKK